MLVRAGDIPMSIQVYGFWRSIASFRVRVALKLKGLSFEETAIDILSGEQFKPGYDAINPEHVVPTFVHDGQSLFQSKIRATSRALKCLWSSSSRSCHISPKSWSSVGAPPNGTFSIYWGIG